MNRQRVCSNGNQWKSHRFFCYAINVNDDTGFIKFVVVDNNLRRKGYGKAMIELALKYAFEITGVKLVQLNVFD